MRSNNSSTYPRVCNDYSFTWSSQRQTLHENRILLFRSKWASLIINLCCLFPSDESPDLGPECVRTHPEGCSVGYPTGQSWPDRNRIANRVSVFNQHFSEYSFKLHQPIRHCSDSLLETAFCFETRTLNLPVIVCFVTYNLNIFHNLYTYFNSFYTYLSLFFFAR